MFAPSGAIDNRSDLSLAHGQDLTHEVERAADEHVALHAGKLPGTIECRLRRYDCFGIVTEYRSQRYSRNRVAGSAGPSVNTARSGWRVCSAARSAAGSRSLNIAKTVTSRSPPIKRRSETPDLVIAAGLCPPSRITRGLVSITCRRPGQVVRARPWRTASSLTSSSAWAVATARAALAGW